MLRQYRRRCPRPYPMRRYCGTRSTARRQTTFVHMNLPIVVPGTRIEIGEPSGLKPWVVESGSIAVFSSHIVRGSISGPDVDQLTGSPAAQTDAGSYLLPLASSGASAKGVGAKFTVREPMPLFIKVVVSALQEPGEYRFPITVALPGKALEVALLSVTVSEVALPTDSRFSRWRRRQPRIGKDIPRELWEDQCEDIWISRLWHSIECCRATRSIGSCGATKWGVAVCGRHGPASEGG